MKNRIKEIRTSAGLSMQAFAERLNLSKGAISLWESGERNIPQKMVKVISKEFGINETWLLTGEGEMKAPPSKEAAIASIASELYRDSEAYPFLLEMIEYIKNMDPAQIKAIYKTAKDIIEIYDKSVEEAE